MQDRLRPREEHGRAAVWLVVGVCVVILVVILQPRGGGGGDPNAESACRSAAALAPLLDPGPGETLTEDGKRAVYGLVDEIREAVEKRIDDPEVAEAAQNLVHGSVEIDAIEERAYGLWRACNEFESQQQGEDAG